MTNFVILASYREFSESVELLHRGLKRNDGCFVLRSGFVRTVAR